MIGRIENINSSIGEVKIVASRVRKNLPQLNSLVKIEVLEKLKSNYKILVDGELYQSKLPIKANSGEIMLAQLVNMNPLTLRLDSFIGSQMLSDGMAGLILKSLGLGKTEIAEKLILELLKSKKHLSKEKIKQFVDFAGSSLTSLDELQFSLLAAIIWDDKSYNSGSEKRAVFSSIFDISFWDLAEQIFQTVLFLNAANLSSRFYERLNEKLIFSPESFESEKILSGISGKAKAYVELSDFIEEESVGNLLLPEVKKSLERLNELLIKYVLQKALLNKYNFYVDFAIVSKSNMLRLWKFSYNKILNQLGEPIYKFETGVSVGKKEMEFELFLVDEKLRGDVFTKGLSNNSEKRYREDFQRVLIENVTKESHINWLKSRVISNRYLAGNIE
jgi:hypothetical protein